MVKLEVGGEYSASLVKRGRKDDGSEWQFVVVKDEKPKSRLEIKLWVRGPVAISQGSSFRVDAIHSVSYGMAEYKGNWYPKVATDVDITALMTYPEYAAMGNPFDDDDFELPL